MQRGDHVFLVSAHNGGLHILEQKKVTKMFCVYRKSLVLQDHVTMLSALGHTKMPKVQQQSKGTNLGFLHKHASI